jgi:phage/plasmid-like protein (TIGR03299 family)
MAHEVETMMYTREKPWHGLGIRVDEAPNSRDALVIAGLDWTVSQQEVRTNGAPFQNDNNEIIIPQVTIPNCKANVRSSDHKVLGIVTNKYKIVQNEEAFAFTDGIVGGGDVRYETAGSLYGGKKIWLLAKLPEVKIVGDETTPYICFTNTHDGSGAVKAIMTPVRVVCNNTLNFALNTAKRSWSMVHTGNLQTKLEEAKHTLEMANDYMTALNEEGEKLANIRITDEKFEEILSELFPVKDDDSDRKKANVETLKTEMKIAVCMPDLANFKGTAWGVLNAMSDVITHNAPRRNTVDYKENNWGRVLEGHPLMDRLFSLVNV